LSGSLKDAPDSVYEMPDSTAWSDPAFTIGGRLAVVQLAAKDAVTVPPEGTVTVCGLELFTVQFAATSVRATL